jgi:penicillin-binding protein 1B
MTTRTTRKSGGATRRPARPRRRRRRRTRGPRRRTWLAVGAAALVGVLGLWLYLDVSVTTRFDGRLWTTPARVYSDVLALERGAPATADDVTARLDRSGYARAVSAPTRPGQYLAAAATLDVYRRAFDTPVGDEPALRARVRFAGGRVASIRDAGGAPLPALALEPELLATLYGSRQEERQLLRLDDVPEPFVLAVLAAEDARFYTHPGLDLRGILRAAAANVRSGKIVQGGSTITQQTVKNLYLDQRRTWWRKVRETLMALVLDARYEKDRILEVYLNEVYLGQRGPVAICGVEAAARYYFGRSLADLSLSEWALLAGMVRSPGRYNPFLHADRAVERRNQVLDAMGRLGFASDVALAAARNEPLVLASGGAGFARGAYAVDYVRRELSGRFPADVVERDGLTVYTTLDTRLQGAAEAALSRGLERLESDVAAVAEQRELRRLQGAVVVTRPSDGAVLAMVGGRDFRESQFNRAVQARRQPGSCFKPFVYAAGFELAHARSEDGLTPATLLEDTPLDLRVGGKLWQPSNYDHRYRGIVTVREALEMSLNVPTVRAARRVGLDRVVRTARECGIESPMTVLPSIALGTAEVTPLELAAAYGTFQQRGMRRDPWVIRAVAWPEAEPLEPAPAASRPALSVQAAYLVDDVLRGVFERGTARSAERLGFHAPAAGKTGTTDDTRDAWFVGYSGDLLALVWVGYDDNARTGLTGASGALPIWVDLMKSSVPDAGRRRREPDDVVRLRIDPESGLRAGPKCPQVTEELFVRGTEPRETCPLHQGRFKRWLRKLLHGEV